MTDKLQWFKIAESLADISFGPNNLAEVTANDKRICIAKQKDELYAFAAKCPHASGEFVNGFIDALGNVVCPLHRYKFCMKNGRNISGEGYYLKHWPVEIKSDGVFVGMDSENFFGLF